MSQELNIDEITTLDDYQREAFRTAIFPAEIGPLYCSMGVLGEAGELASVMKDYYASVVDDTKITSDFRLILNALHTATEACKEVERLKKLARKGLLALPELPPLTDEIRARARSEQGDCLWYQAGTAEVTGNKLSNIAQQNIRKLRERRDAGVISSQGETIAERKASI